MYVCLTTLLDFTQLSHPFFSYSSNGTRSDKRRAKREEHKEPLPGVRPVHQQHQPPELEEGQQLRGHHQ